MLDIIVNWIVKAFWRWNDDRIKLKASSGIASDLRVVEQIGCIGCIFTVKNGGKRPVKIKEAWVARKDPESLAAFEYGFDSPLVVWSNGEPPSAKVIYPLLQLPEPGNGFTRVERGDAVRFILPVQTHHIDRFSEVKSEDVTMGVTLVDDTEIVLLQGLQLQNTLRDLVNFPAPPSSLLFQYCWV
jgi:hypothetical protein